MKRNDIKNWININFFMENGIIKLKNNKYLKLIKIYPINYNLKSDLEKEAILSAYRTFLKTCDFDIQILIQSKKEDLSKNISIIEKNIKSNQEYFLKEIANDYINFIRKANLNNKSSSKNFYIIVSNTSDKQKSEELILEELNEKYIKIKECMLRCGNYVSGNLEKSEVIQIFDSFLNSRKYLK